MPVSTKRTRVNSDLCTLRIPQVRVLVALMPSDPSVSSVDWPSMTSPTIARRLGTSEVSDYVRRAMRGLRPGSSSGNAHRGLLAMGYASEYTLDIDGVSEIHYRITTEGIAALTAYLAEHGKLPPIRPASTCTNRRYLKE